MKDEKKPKSFILLLALFVISVVLAAYGDRTKPFLGDLDIPSLSGNAGKIILINASGTGIVYESKGTLASISFLDLIDMEDSSYEGKGNTFLAVSIGETGVYLASPPELPDIASRAGSVLRVKDDGLGVEWWEARDYCASFSTFAVSLATNSTVLLSTLASPTRGDVLMIENGSAWQGDYIAFGPAASSAAQLRSAGHQLNKQARFTARLATSGFDLGLCSSHERVGTGVISIFWGAK